MPRTREPDTDSLLHAAAEGDGRARQRLLVRHRDRLRKMVAYHMDRRLAARVDPSDIVQETLAQAAQRLDDYLRQRPLPFYPWLRQLAWDRLIDEFRRHVGAGKRSVHREEPGVLDLPDESAVELASRLLDLGSSPSSHLLREELRRRVREALAQLPARDQAVLELRLLEQLSTRDTAAVLKVSEGVVKTRHLRALQRLRQLLDGDFTEGTP
jgi:RNA polymerase sigma-70 factor (ECF subfamily)